MNFNNKNKITHLAFARYDQTLPLIMYNHIIKFTIIPILKIQPFLLCIKYKKKKSKSSISNQTNGKIDKCYTYDTHKRQNFNSH